MIANLFNKVNNLSREVGLAIKALRTEVESKKIGGSNLLWDSDKPYSGANYMLRYELKEVPKVGEEVIVTLWGEVAEDRTGIGIYNTQGFTELFKLDKIADGVYQGKGVWGLPMNGSVPRTPNNTHLNVYFYPNSATSINNIKRVKLERGNTGTDWSSSTEVVGGTNLLNGSRTFSHPWRLSSYDGNASWVIDKDVATITSPGATPWKHVGYYIEKEEATNLLSFDSTFTLSVYAKKVSGTVNNFNITLRKGLASGFDDTLVTGNFTVTSEWKRFVVRGTITKEGVAYLFPRFEWTGDCVVQLKHPKLEFGGVVSDWNPSPDDSIIANYTGSGNGVNLLKNTKNPNADNPLSMASLINVANRTENLTLTYPSEGVMKFASTRNTNRFLPNVWNDNRKDFELGKTYTLSGFVKGSSNFKTGARWFVKATNWTNVVTQYDVKTEWSRFAVTYTFQEDPNVTGSFFDLFYNIPAESSIEFKLLKLEEGSVPTTYSEAPEDISGFRFISGPKDLNTYTKTGKYFFKDGAYTNSPIATWSYLIVEAAIDNTRVMQTLRSDVDINTHYTRVKKDGTWTKWERLLTEDSTIPAAKLTGVIPNARISGSYNNISLELNSTYVMYASQSPGSPVKSYTVYGAAEYKELGPVNKAVVFKTPIAKGQQATLRFDIKGTLSHPDNDFVDMTVYVVSTTTAPVVSNTAIYRVNSGRHLKIQAAYVDNYLAFIVNDPAIAIHSPHLSITEVQLSNLLNTDALKGWSISTTTNLAASNISNLTPLKLVRDDKEISTIHKKGISFDETGPSYFFKTISGNLMPGENTIPHGIEGDKIRNISFIFRDTFNGTDYTIPNIDGKYENNVIYKIKGPNLVVENPGGGLNGKQFFLTIMYS